MSEVKLGSFQLLKCCVSEGHIFEFIWKLVMIVGWVWKKTMSANHGDVNERKHLLDLKRTCIWSGFQHGGGQKPSEISIFSMFFF